MKFQNRQQFTCLEDLLKMHKLTAKDELKPITSDEFNIRVEQSMI